ncbi:imidazoleglycerol-phosphate dehydratase [Candidatus Hakubella thermalkaliphila]|uniref:Imidazoleglycerol-phosphate dehydratase n=1 Tax=Candidatus Hakubella thermalkaliphila TaxID=2754717 RepID=A0A6V8PCG5_9ACTN|nr:imidazoleglycerol-phosphate dehydratase [Candidatus Hakubella thermalkaliphila]GFP38898.1 imidazoleglycerol-phosphate dehydratase [Candidatus Hakubella thermalkaliphila]GFP40901.1 imidazoleglycerol-phosphate dehydratase [Candidatus Hakubella thermalkaliphila]
MSKEDTMNQRVAEVNRKTRETNIRVRLNLDGSGRADISTGIPFFDHMLEQLAKHGLFDLEIAARGDIKVDGHHTVEDVGLSLGRAFGEALGDKSKIVRYGFSVLPMDETLVMLALDIGGRPYLRADVQLPYESMGKFDTLLLREFLAALVNSMGINLHVSLWSGDNPHHIVEAIFKALGRALDMATRIDERIGGVPSTKGVI